MLPQLEDLDLLWPQDGLGDTHFQHNNVTDVQPYLIAIRDAAHEAGHGTLVSVDSEVFHSYGVNDTKREPATATRVIEQLRMAYTDLALDVKHATLWEWHQYVSPSSNTSSPTMYRDLLKYVRSHRKPMDKTTTMASSTTTTTTTKPPRLFLGPTANLQMPSDDGTVVDKVSIVNQLLSLVDDSAGLDSWPDVRGMVQSTHGCLHIRNQVFGFMTAAQQMQLALATQKIGLGVSIETGGSMCGAGSGELAAQRTLSAVQPFLSNGGRFTNVLLESVFSRTVRGCRSQPHATTARELALFASTLLKGLTNIPSLFLYDALPHFSMLDWPANDPSYDLAVEEIVPMLRNAMANVNTTLAGYWMDCPYEYSRDYPNTTDPLPAGSGFKKIADTVAYLHGARLLVGKTFNSQQGGAVSDQLFYTATQQDWQQTQSALLHFSSGSREFTTLSLDFVMVETWYPHPLYASPESKSYTTTYTARDVMQRAINGSALYD